MKKFIALAIAVVMLAALAVPAFAATQTEVTYTVSETYEFSITPSIPLQDVATDVVCGSGEVSVTTLNILSGNTLIISADGHTEKKYNLDATGNVGETTATIIFDTVEFSFASGTDELVKAFNINWVTKPTVAADYAKTITFSAVID